MEDWITIQKIALSHLQGLGPKKTQQLVSGLGNIDSIFSESLRTLHHHSKINMDVIKNIDRESALKKAESVHTFNIKNNITTHFYLDTNFPRRLRQCPDMPIILYSKGNFNFNAQKVVAIVGTRKASVYGKNLCAELIEQFTINEIQVISGLAYGIDICVHQNCLANGIENIGVLGHGLDRIYPQVHKRTAEKMYEKGGLLTEFTPGTNPDRENFPMRNRIVAGMADATIVIESKKTGGSLITASLANDYHRDVFAYPGNIGIETSEGCNLLIQRNQAQLLLNGEDFLNQMNWKENENKKDIQRSCFIEMNEIESKVFNFLKDNGGQFVDVISIKTQLPISELSIQLFHLEMKGLVKSLPGKKYCII